MDPSEIACRVYDTFEESKPVYDPKDLPPHFSMTDPLSLTSNVKIKKISDLSSGNFYGDFDMYNSLQTLKEEVYFGEWETGVGEALSYADPFSDVGLSVFNSSNSIVLANIDAIYKLTGHYSGLLKQRLDKTFDKAGVTQSPIYEEPVGLFTEDKNFFVCCVNDSGGGFVNYLQFRVKDVKIFGMNPEDVEWNVSNLSTKYLTISYGEDGTGNLTSNWEYFLNDVRGKVQDGVQLVTANGGDSRPYEEGLYAETDNFIEVVRECIVSLGCCGKSGSVVIKVFDTFTQASAELLFVLAQCFEAIDLFKPITSSHSSTEKYFIGSRRKSDDIVNLYIDILKNIVTTHKKRYITSSVIKDKLPEEYIEWLTQINNNTLTNQMEFWTKIQKLLNNEPIDNKQQYNLRTALKIWSLPGNIPKSRAWSRI